MGISSGHLEEMNRYKSIFNKERLMQCKAVSIVLIIFLLHIYARNVLSLFFSFKFPSLFQSLPIG